MLNQILEAFLAIYVYCQTILFLYLKGMAYNMTDVSVLTIFSVLILWHLRRHWPGKNRLYQGLLSPRDSTQEHALVFQPTNPQTHKPTSLYGFSHSETLGPFSTHSEARYWTTRCHPYDPVCWNYLNYSILNLLSCLSCLDHSYLQSYKKGTCPQFLSLFACWIHLGVPWGGPVWHAMSCF